VTNISPTGFWVLLDGRELFLPFADFPWFRSATVGQITNVRRPSPHHLHWPDLDVDLAMDSIEHPERFPLVSLETPRRARRPVAGERDRVKGRKRDRVRAGNGPDA